MRVSIPVALVLGVLLAPAVGAAELPKIDPIRILSAAQGGAPEEWGGIWNISYQLKECTSGAVLFSDSYVDTICSGEAVDVSGDGGDTSFQCTYQINGSSVTADCVGTVEVFTGCNAEITTHFEASVSGNSYTATVTSNTTYNGEACIPELTDTCSRAEFTGTKTGPEPASFCQTPVEESRWGTIKALYR